MDQACAEARGHIDVARRIADHVQAHGDMVDDRGGAGAGGEGGGLGVEYAAFHQERSPVGTRKPDADDAAADRGDGTVFAKDGGQRGGVALNQPDRGFVVDQTQRISAARRAKARQGKTCRCFEPRGDSTRIAPDFERVERRGGPQSDRHLSHDNAPPHCHRNAGRPHGHVPIARVSAMSRSGFRRVARNRLRAGQARWRRLR